jgi:hypothetical protein
MKKILEHQYYLVKTARKDLQASEEASTLK